MMADRAPLVLASASPRRAEILRSLGIPFTVLPTDIPEEPLPGETAEAAAVRLASEKAAKAAALAPGAWVLAADTLVFLDGVILGKPRDDREAAAMLRRLSGREHGVVTAVALFRSGAPGARLAEVSRVGFAPLDEEEIVVRGDRRAADKAGAYGVQGLGARFIEEIRARSPT
jgi:septum formation protein